MNALKGLPPPLDPHCRLIAILAQDGKPVLQEDSSEILVDLSGGADAIEWNPNLQTVQSMRGVALQRGQDSYNLRVWKRRHDWLGITVNGGSSEYAEPPFTDPWADWLDQHIDCRFLIAGVEFMIVSASPSRNGVEYWLTGRRVTA